MEKPTQELLPQETGTETIAKNGYEKAEKKLDAQKQKEKQEVISSTKKRLNTLKQEILQSNGMETDPNTFVKNKMIRLHDVYKREGKKLQSEGPGAPITLDTKRNDVVFHIEQVIDDAGTSFQVTVTDKGKKHTFSFTENPVDKKYTMTGNHQNSVKYISML